MLKKLTIFFLASLLVFALPSCNRKSGCPTYDKKTGEYSIKGKKKSDSGLFPKNMK